MKKSITGFTIVELLIVIVVIAILVTFSSITYRGIQDRASVSRFQSTLSQARKNAELYKVEHGKWPFEDDVRQVLAGSNPDAAANVVRAWFTNEFPQGTYYGFVASGCTAPPVMNTCVQTNAQGDITWVLVGQTAVVRGDEADATGNWFMIGSGSATVYRADADLKLNRSKAR